MLDLLEVLRNAVLITGLVLIMMLMIENINKSLDRIKSIVNTAYFQTWKFIKARTSYWKSELYRSKTIREVANDALGRWMEAGMLDY